jgi:hypothetical protein
LSIIDGSHRMAAFDQPRLRLAGCEFFGEAKTVTGNVWWYEEPQGDGSVRRIPLIPIEPAVLHNQEGMMAKR